MTFKEFFFQIVVNDEEKKGCLKTITEKMLESFQSSTDSDE